VTSTNMPSTVMSTTVLWEMWATLRAVSTP
jgi:hypothetical protein